MALSSCNGRYHNSHLHSTRTGSYSCVLRWIDWTLLSYVDWIWYNFNKWEHVNLNLSIQMSVQETLERKKIFTHRTFRSTCKKSNRNQLYIWHNWKTVLKIGSNVVGKQIYAHLKALACTSKVNNLANLN